ncbi:MAG: hypothetical protein B9S33_20140 [Pedosphaera sp. Tous-C6FEB]|nr:MAG: hypothetical protein B9S33_20140 [Pedosphaera sp. Tous-C6FEB]
MSQLEIVYVLTNPAMPKLVKIGRTSQADAKTRIDQLFTTGVPVPFEMQFACKVENADEVEKALHKAFAPNRINPKREFFEIDPEQAIAILKLLHVEDATMEVAKQAAVGSEVDEQSIVAGKQLKKARSPNLNFAEMGIPTGSILESVDNDTTVVVAGPRRVRLGEEELSLTAATRKVLNNTYDVAPIPHWAFNGRSLSEIYDETYAVVDD